MKKNNQFQDSVGDTFGLVVDSNTWNSITLTMYESSRLESEDCAVIELTIAQAEQVLKTLEDAINDALRHD